MTNRYELVVLAAIVALAAILIAVGFLVLVWRLSWCLKGYIATELLRSKYEERVVAMLHDYIEGQRNTNEQLWMSMQVHADRFNRWTAKKTGNGIRE